MFDIGSTSLVTGMHFMYTNLNGQNLYNFIHGAVIMCYKALNSKQQRIYLAVTCPSARFS